MMHKFGGGVLLLLAFLLSPFGCFGQTTVGSSGTMVGTVRDASVAVAPSAKVIATHNEMGIAFEKTTNQTGDYSFPNLPIGTYALMVTTQIRQFSQTERHRGGQFEQEPDWLRNANRGVAALRISQDLAN